MFKKLIIFIGIVVLIGSIFSGCGPTYPKETLTESVVQLCKKEYDLDVKAKVEGKTLGVYLVTKDPIIDQTQQISQKAIEYMGDIFLVISRVALSTDADLDFCVAIIADPSIGIEWMLTRYVRDIKMMYANIPREEIFRRTDFDLQPMKTNGEDFQLRDMPLTEFLARQISTRIKSIFSTEKNLKDDFEIKLLETIYKEPEDMSAVSGYNGVFSVIYNIVPKENASARVEDIDLVQLVNAIAAHVVEYIASTYNFSAYDGIEVISVSEAQRSFFNKAEIKRMRNKYKQFLK